MGTSEAWTLLSLGLGVIGVRVYVRWTAVGPSQWQLDDYLMPLTGLVFALETTAAYLVGAWFQGLTNSYMTDDERANLDPNSDEYFNRQWGSKIQVLGWSLYAMILWLLKFCVTVFYSRLTNGLVYLRLRVRIAYGLLAVTYLVVGLSILLGCQPMNRYWQINPDPGNLCQPTISRLYVFVVVIPNIITDIYLLSIPVPLLWGVNIGLRKKLSLILLFSGAIFVMMASTIRAVVIVTAGPNGAVSGSEWACRETFVAIVVTNLPIIHPLIRKGASKIGLSGLFSRTSKMGRSYPLSSRAHKGDEYAMTKRNQVQTRVMATKSGWDSDDAILNMDGKSAAGTSGHKSDDSNTRNDIVVGHVITVTHEHIDSTGPSEERPWVGFATSSDRPPST